MARVDYDRLNRYSTALQLHIGDTRNNRNVQVMNGLAVVQAQCVTRGLAADPNAIYLVELTDVRGVLCNEWVKYPLTAAYNIRSPGYPQTFQLATMKDYPAAGAGSKTTWTWSTMLEDMWLKMPLLGTWPGLPYAPAGTPEGFWFSGVAAWPALCDVLGYLGMSVACDLTQSSPYTIVDDGADDPALTLAQAAYRGNLEDDLEWIDVGSGRVPSAVRVIFRRRNATYGTEETVAYRNDGMAQQWDTAAYYYLTVAAPATFALAAGTHHLWSDFTVRYDVDGNPLAADVAVAAAIAQERVTQYFNRVYSRTSGYMTQVYAGALPFATGSQVDGVCWHQDYGNQERQGWKTRVVRGPSPPFDVCA